MFIAVCGSDGSGKTTTCEALAVALAMQGHDVYRTKNPSPAYFDNQFIRAYRTTGSAGVRVEVMALLSAYNRLTQYEREIRPEVDAGAIVVCDRYKIDGIANFSYRGVDESWLTTINAVAPNADLTLLLTCSPEIARNRIVARGETVSFDESADILSRKVTAYGRAATIVPDTKIIRADRPQHLVVHDVYEEVRKMSRLRTPHLPIIGAAEWASILAGDRGLADGIVRRARTEPVPVA